MTDPIRVDELMSIADYEENRVEMRRRIIALKRFRRVVLGDHISIVFENRDTMLFQIHEMMRAEGIVDPEALQAECDVYNTLLPRGNELSATMFIELPPGTNARMQLEMLMGVDERTFLLVGEEEVAVEVEDGRSGKQRICSVLYFRFPLSPEQISEFKDESVDVVLKIDHENYQARVSLAGHTRQSLTEDLA